MELTKQRKMLLGVLCIGAVGLAVDRLFLATPQSAEADDRDVVAEVPPPTVAPPAGSQPAPAAEPKSAALPSYASLTQRLVQAQQQASATAGAGRDDPFALPEQWRAEPSKPRAKTPEPASSSSQRLTVVFKLDGTVRSLIDGKEEIMAVISGGGLDGRAVRVGQKIRVANANGTKDEYELVEVGPRYTVWLNEATGERIEMRVEEVL